MIFDGRPSIKGFVILYPIVSEMWKRLQLKVQSASLSFKKSKLIGYTLVFFSSELCAKKRIYTLRLKADRSQAFGDRGSLNSGWFRVNRRSGKGFIPLPSGAVDAPSCLVEGFKQRKIA